MLCARLGSPPQPETTAIVSVAFIEELLYFTAFILDTVGHTIAFCQCKMIVTRALPDMLTNKVNTRSEYKKRISLTLMLIYKV